MSDSGQPEAPDKYIDHLRSMLTQPAIGLGLDVEPTIALVKQMLGERAMVLGTFEAERGGDGRYSCAITTGDGRLLRVAVRRAEKARGKQVSLHVQTSIYPLDHLGRLAFEETQSDTASARLDFDQEEPIEFTAHTPEATRALKQFVGVLGSLIGRGRAIDARPAPAEGRGH